MPPKIVNPETSRLVDMNKALGHSLLAKYAPELVPDNEKILDGKIVNPATKRLVDMNGALCRSLLAKYAPELVPK